jgi:phage terminase Nu1 subunit (DNA packaging protein)
MKTTTNDPATIAADQLADLSNLSRRRLYQLAEAGKIPPASNGRFEMLTTIRALFSYYQADDENLLAEKIKLTHEQAEIARIKKENLLRENIPAELVERVWAGTILELRSKILYADLPDKVKTDLLRDLQTIPIDQFFQESKTAKTHEGETPAETPPATKF